MGSEDSLDVVDEVFVLVDGSGIGAITAVERVALAVAGVDYVVASIAVELIVAVAANKRVISSATTKRVIPIATVKLVLPGSSA